MKKCVQLWVVVILLLIGSVAKSQSEVSAGYVNSGNKVLKGMGRSIRGHGVNVGYMYEYDFFTGFSLKGGGYYSYVRSGEKTTISDVNFDSKLQEHFVTLSFNANYKYDFSTDYVLFAYAGPRLVACFSSKWQLSANSSLYPDMNGEATLNQDQGSDLFSWYFGGTEAMPSWRFEDAQLGFGVGVELFERLVVKAGLDFGLLNRYSDSSSTNVMRRNQFYLNIGYRFD
ncbi:MAG: PorT family protein [Bacteroidales bacterium]|jgi:hypothetical protein|nr:PorT family protein [Bacteroidales bacterium]